jgi:hypothetical protein
MHTNLALLVQEEDIGLFYTLLGQYHQDPARFRVEANKLVKGNDESAPRAIERFSGKSQEASAGTADENINLYAYVTKNCSCGQCYNALARQDRVPWKSTADSNIFSNAKHGKVTIPMSCGVSQFAGMGYIYVPPSQVAVDNSAANTIFKAAEDRELSLIKLKEKKLALLRDEAKVKKEQQKVQDLEYKKRNVELKEKEEIGQKRSRLDYLKRREHQERMRWNSVIQTMFEIIKEDEKEVVDYEGKSYDLSELFRYKETPYETKRLLKGGNTWGTVRRSLEELIPFEFSDIVEKESLEHVLGQGQESQPKQLAGQRQESQPRQPTRKTGLNISDRPWELVGQRNVKE